MHQASWIHRRSSSPGSKVWNHNTGYTGAAGIHSEVGSGAHARNNLTERRSSNSLTAEEEIMKKEMRKLQASRKNMEKSMLLYSQKMRDISQRKSPNAIKSPIPFHSTANQKGNSNINGKDQNMRKKAVRIPSSSTLPSVSTVSSKELSLKDDISIVSDSSTHVTTRGGESRLSLDSGISLDSSRSLQSHTLSDVIESPGKESIHETDSHQLEDDRRSRARQRKRFRDSKTFKLMPLVDKEIKENEVLVTDPEEEIITPRIAPFPDELLQKDFDISSFVLSSIMENDEMLGQQGDNRVGGSIVGRKNNRGAGTRKNKPKTKYVLFRPKVSQSPSLAALRHRLFRRFGPKSIYFRYSEEVLEALRSLSNSPDRQKSGKSFQSLSPSRSLSPQKSPVSSPTLHGIDLDELLEAHSLRPGGLFRLFMEEDVADEFFLTKDLPKPPKLSRERSFSAPSSKESRHSFVSKLEQVDETDDGILKSVLKKDDGDSSSSNLSNEKKNVQFFLPDIFMKANMCTSQPAEFR